jgi:hypothetical protein
MRMSRLEILGVNIFAGGPEIFKFRIDQPRSGQAADIYSFTFSGWVLGQDAPVESLAISCRGDRIKEIPVNLLRPEVSARYPNAAGSGAAGFNTEIGVVGLPETCDLEISAQIGDGEPVLLGTITLRHGPLETTYTPQLQPLMITSLGRSGSTWSMRLFGEHPDIVINRVHPYEVMAANYWVHLAKVLTDPANHSQSSERLGFADRHWKIGQNPYFTRPVIKYPEMRSWFGYDLVARTAGFCMQNIDEYYLRLAEAQGEPVPRFFAEKNRANHIPRMFFDLYPGAREIFVIRDFRDMACSMFSFNRKRGYVGVGPKHAADEIDFIRKLRPSIERMLEAYRERSGRSLLVKYEDLVLQPENVLPGVLDYLGVRSDPETILNMRNDAAKTPRTSVVKGLLARFVPSRFQARSPEFFSRMKSHQTSGGDPSRSVGRWSTDLTPELQAVANEAFGDLLEEAGYPAGTG